MCIFSHHLMNFENNARNLLSTVGMGFSGVQISNIIFRVNLIINLFTFVYNRYIK